jgi:predicted amidophosphoribosyltransferase
VPITNCPSCRKEILDASTICPHCEADLKEKSPGVLRREWTIGLIGLALLVAFLTWLLLF